MTEDKNYMYADMTKVAELLEEKRTDGEGFALEIRSYKDDIYLYNFLKDKINGTLEKPSIEQYYPHYLIITAHEHKEKIPIFSKKFKRLSSRYITSRHIRKKG